MNNCANTNRQTSVCTRAGEEMASKRAGKGDRDGDVSGVQEIADGKSTQKKNPEHDAKRSECVDLIQCKHW